MLPFCPDTLCPHPGKEGPIEWDAWLTPVALCGNESPKPSQYSSNGCSNSDKVHNSQEHTSWVLAKTLVGSSLVTAKSEIGFHVYTDNICQTLTLR
jgi:hypothetical protein